MKGTAALKEYRRKVQAGLIVPKKVRARPSAIKAIKNKCKECACDFVDGRIDCEMEDCSLYYWMPYGAAVKKRRRDKG